MCVKTFLFTQLIVISLFRISVSDLTCHDTYKDYHKYLATKTGYRFIQNLNDVPLTFQDCKLTKIWGLVRHGTRLPGDKVIDKMRHHLSTLQKKIIDNFSQEKTQLCDISLLKCWEPRVSGNEEEKSLTEEGERELHGLGQRMRNRFPALLNQKFKNETFFFKYTKTQRTQASAFHFAEGVFGREASLDVWYPASQKRDPILRFYKACEKWRETVDHNPEAYAERVAFERTELFRQLVARVNKRLGFDGSLTVEDIVLMYTSCGFESAWDPGFESPWCALFSRQDLELLEYREDLDYYWIDGHGYPLTGSIACVAFQDMIKHMRSSESERDVIFYFTHSGTLLKFLTHLKVYNDSIPLRHDNFENMKRRKWRVSEIDAFGTNVVFANYRCENNGDHLVVLHQEKPILLPGCPSILCPLSTVLNTYRQSLESCEFESMCRYQGDGKKKESLRDENTDHDEL